MRIDYRERPGGMEGFNENRLTWLLPYEAARRGWQLVELTPPQYSQGVDPYILRDQWGHILYQWPDDYEPSWGEVKDVCERLYD